LQYLQATFQPAAWCQQTSLVFFYLFSRFCASSICGECSRKKINNERACDFCFLKQNLKKQEHERRENFRQRELNIERMNKEIKDFEKEIEDLDK
jgi:hypothetical protein